MRLALMATRWVGIMILGMALVGCNTTPKYSDRPPLALPSSYASTEQTAYIEVKDSLLAVFSSDTLRSMVDRALANNPDLKRTQARLQEAGFNLTQSRAGLLPTLTGSASAGRLAPVGAASQGTFAASLDVAWEVDVWGRVSSRAAAARADERAALADYNAARQSLVAQTMQAWFQLIANEQTVQLNERRIETFVATEQLIGRRFDLGRANLGDLELARTDVANAMADLEAARNRRDQASRALNVLAGSYPDTDLTAQVWPALHNTVPAGLPSELLLLRPDIIAAFERVRAADERVDVAHAELFPSFVLTAEGGRQTSQLSDIVRSAFDTWSALGNITAPLLDHGLRRAELGAAGKRAAQAYYTYQSVVLRALQEVENALGSEAYLAREEAARVRALEAATKAEDRTRRDYDGGLVDIFTLLNAQQRVFNVEQQTINIRASRLNNRVSLALALGKGY